MGQKNPRRRRRQGTLCLIRGRGQLACCPPFCNAIQSTRLSATDISALASMKNVAKCDTWCELQNPANHRVFERMLRPRPPGRGHACLGVTPKHAPTATPCGGQDAAYGSPCLWARLAEDRAAGVSCRAQRVVGDLALLSAALQVRSRRKGLQGPQKTECASLRPRPQVRRDYPLSLSI